MKRIPYLLLVVVYFASCHPTPIRSITGPVVTSDYVETESIAGIEVPSDTTSAVYMGIKKKAALQAFYVELNFKPVWYNNNALTQSADTLMAIIERAGDYGLLSEDYHFNGIHLLNASTTDSMVRRELLLTDAFILFSKDLKFGKVKSKNVIGDSVQISLLRQVLADSGVVRTLAKQEPAFTGYQSLKEIMRLYQDSLSGSSVSSNTRIDSVRISNTITRIAVNMERWRWERKPFGNQYVFVNIPAFMVRVVKQDSDQFSSRIIVGKPGKPTPVLSSVIKSLVIYPYWTVPRKIASEELLPSIQGDSLFLERNNFDVLNHAGKILNIDSIPWQGFTKDYFPVVLRQRDGVDNSLGVIKFVFDNPFAVYLHDTNAKGLFKTNTRAFSHGCVRIEKAVELAHFLVTEELGKHSERLTTLLDRQQQYWWTLRHPIGINIRYFTCEVVDGQFKEYRDIYNLDDMLAQFFISEELLNGGVNYDDPLGMEINDYN